MIPTRCPQCGAPNPETTDQAGLFRCRFCESTFREQQAAPVPIYMPTMQAPRGAGSGAGIVIVAVLALVLLMGGGAAVFLLTSGSSKQAPGPPPVATAATVEPVPTVAPVEPEVPASAIDPEKFLGPRWASGRIFPIGVDVDGDGTEDLIGPTVHHDGANTQIWVTAFDGKTFKKKHEVGPFGKAGNNVENDVQMAVAGKRFVVLDPKGDAHLYELDTGKLVVDFPFREENRGMCGPPALEPKVLVRVGKGDFIIDTASGIGKPGAPPPWCAGDKYMRRRPSESFNHYFSTQAESLQPMGFTKEKLEALKPPPKMQLELALVDGPLIVALARQNGVDGSSLLGFDQGGKLLYQVAGDAIGLDGRPANKDLAFGRFVFAKGDRTIVALDAKTGEKLWGAKLSPDGNVGKMSLTEKRVWVARWKGDDAWVEAIDATSGKVLGSTGK